jgi:hypothetical protein
LGFSTFLGFFEAAASDQRALSTSLQVNVLSAWTVRPLSHQSKTEVAMRRLHAKIISGSFADAHS